jgi:hypothetical protein
MTFARMKGMQGIRQLFSVGPWLSFIPDHFFQVTHGQS